MKDKRLVLFRLGAVALALSIVALLAVTPIASAKKGGNGKGPAKIVWSANPLRAEVAPGGTFMATVTFTSSKNLTNVHLDWTPSLGDTTTISQVDFPVIMAGVPNAVDVTFTAPADGTRENYNGVVHLRTGSKNYPANLKLRFAVPVAP